MPPTPFFFLLRIKSTVLDDISCTDLAQKWSKLHMKKWSKKEFSGEPLENQCHFQPKEKVIIFDLNEIGYILMELFKG